MKKIIFILTLLAVLGACTTDQRLKALEGMPDGVLVKQIHMMGQNCIWSPNHIEFDENTHVILVMESLDIPYNCNMEKYKLHFKIPVGEKIIAEFYVPEQDRLAFGCRIEKNYHYQWGGVSAELTAGIEEPSDDEKLFHQG